MKSSFKMFASQVTRAVCPRCRGSMVGSGDQWKCEECPGTRKHTQVGGSRARRQNSDVQFHHFVWFHQLGAEVAEVMARIVAVSRKEVARLSNCWSREYFTDLEIVNLPCEGGVRRLQQFSDWVGRLLDWAAQSCETTFQRARRARTGELLVPTI